MEKKSNIFWFCILVCSVIGSIVLLKGYSPSKSSNSTSSSFDNLVPEEYTDDSNTTHTTDFEIIQDGLNDMGFLVTQEYYFTQLEKYTKSKNIAFFTSESSFTYSYDGVVEAGVDFTDIELSTDEENKIIYVSIPDAEIHSITIDENSFKKYNEDSSFWNPIKIEDFNTAQSEFKENAKDKALERGVLDKADKQAKIVISNFVEKLVDVSEYTIEYR